MDLSQFAGFLIFLGILTMGFWLMIFLLTFVVPYWIAGYFKENWQEKRNAKKAAKKE